ncbi:MAG: hypothetical protein JJ971_08215 [Balneolaceae bacterium]|nr:hypothetical protein [Balneolaceae bacterium]MBO6546778.1 hypothetical protein [Balneolaceae bacterium]MBO6649138.1 hypothetical protein [Balneolaceae bacterium]
MRGLIFLLVFIVSISGCGLFDASEEKPKPEYEWEELGQFRDRWNTAVEITPDDILFIAQDEKLFRSTNHGEDFQRLSTPDSADIVRIRTLNNKLYIIGDVYRPDGGDWGRDVSWIYVSEDNGQSWEVVTGGYIMQDITYLNNRLHIGRKHGVTTLDLETGESFRNSFIHSKLSDHIEEIEVTSDGRIFLASHDGLHASFDNGETWTKVSTNIHKNYDFFRSLEIDENDNLYLSEYERIYKVMGQELYWEHYKIKNGNDQIKLLPDNKLLLLASDDLKISDRDELSFMEIQPKSTQEYGPYFDFIDTFSNGNIILAGHSHVFLGRKME